MKKYATTLILALSITVYCQQPKHIVWDIHKVILQKDFYSMACAFIQYPYWIDIFKKLNLNLIKQCAFLTWTGSTSDEFIHIAQKYKNPKMAQLISTIGNKQKPIKGTIKIIKTLHKNNAQQYVGSNIGPIMFDDLQKKMPHLFNDTIFDLEHSQIGTYNGQTIIKKPNPVFFHQFLQKNNLYDNPESILFIDDKIENIKAARTFGMRAILFKNPQQLRTQLIKYGILSHIHRVYKDKII